MLLMSSFFVALTVSCVLWKTLNFVTSFTPDVVSFRDVNAPTSRIRTGTSHASRKLRHATRTYYALDASNDWLRITAYIHRG